MASAKPTLVQGPWMGLMLDRPSQMMPPTAFEDCLNVRIEQNKIRSDLMGAIPLAAAAGEGTDPQPFGPEWANGIYTFVKSNGNVRLVCGTPGDLFALALPFDNTAFTRRYLTPVYGTGLAQLDPSDDTTIRSFGTYTTRITVKPMGVTPTVEVLADAGSTSIHVSDTTSLTVGHVIACVNRPQAILPGTKISNIASLVLTIDTPLAEALRVDDTITQDPLYGGHLNGDVTTFTIGAGAGGDTSMVVDRVPSGTFVGQFIDIKGLPGVLPQGTTISSISGTTIHFLTPIGSGFRDVVPDGSTVIFGGGTFWETRIGGTAQATVKTTSPAQSDVLVLKALPRSVFVGQLVQIANNAAALPVDTLVQAIEGNTITLTNFLAYQVNKDDPVLFGQVGPHFRNNARAGDQIAFGATGITDVYNTDWYDIVAVPDDNTLVLSQDASGALTRGSAYTIRQRFLSTFDPGSPPNQFQYGFFEPNWSFETFPQAGAPFNSDIMIATNGIDPVFAWDGVQNSGTYRVEVPFLAQKVRRYKNMMIYGGLTGSNGAIQGTSIANSDNALPTIMAGGVAGQYVVADGPGTSMALSILGGTLLVGVVGKQEGAVYSAQFVGFPTNFAFSQIVTGRGPIGSRLVAEFPDRVQYLAWDGMYRYNGLFIQVMNDHIWRDLLNQTPNIGGIIGSTYTNNFGTAIDYRRIELGYTTINPTHGDLIWVVPLVGDTYDDLPSTAFVEHYMEQAQSYLFKPYTRRDWYYRAAATTYASTPVSWDTAGSMWSDMFIPWVTQPAVNPYVLHYASGFYPDGSGTIGNFSSLYQNNTAGNDVAAQYVKFAKRPVSDGTMSRGLVQRLYPFFQQVYPHDGPFSEPQTVAITLNLFERPSETDTESTTSVTYNYGTIQNARFVPIYHRGFWSQLQIGNTTGAVDGEAMWILEGYDWQVITGGRRGLYE